MPAAFNTLGREYQVASPIMHAESLSGLRFIICIRSPSCTRIANLIHHSRYRLDSIQGWELGRIFFSVGTHCDIVIASRVIRNYRWRFNKGEFWARPVSARSWATFGSRALLLSERCQRNLLQCHLASVIGSRLEFSPAARAAATVIKM